MAMENEERERERERESGREIVANRAINWVVDSQGTTH
jgi:hypothetical protein